MHKFVKFFSGSLLVISGILLVSSFVKIANLASFITLFASALGTLVMACVLAWMDNVSEELASIRKAVNKTAGLNENGEDQKDSVYDGSNQQNDPSNKIFV